MPESVQCDASDLRTFAGMPKWCLNSSAHVAVPAREYEVSSCRRSESFQRFTGNYVEGHRSIVTIFRICGLHGQQATLQIDIIPAKRQQLGPSQTRMEGQENKRPQRFRRHSK